MNGCLSTHVDGGAFHVAVRQVLILTIELAVVVTEAATLCGLYDVCRPFEVSGTPSQLAILCRKYSVCHES